MLINARLKSHHLAELSLIPPQPPPKAFGRGPSGPLEGQGQVPTEEVHEHPSR
jgi:hypothetical protein